MNVLIDTSVLISAFVPFHQFHARAIPILNRAKAGEWQWCVSQHTLVEVYRVLTSMPSRPKIDPERANRLLDENVLSSASIIGLSPSDYIEIIKLAVRLKLSGGIIFDAIITHAAQKAHVDRLYTFNSQHFLRVWPDGKGIITEP